MRILTIADKECRALWDYYQPGRLEGIDLILSCGDLKQEYLEFLVTMTNRPLYYVCGNHDKGYGNYRDFSLNELYDELEKNGVVILKDESVLIDDKFYLVGRNDRSDPERAPVSELTAELDSDKYTIILDHQPNDYAAEAETSADLVLSGHTHGGHIFPAGLVGLAMGANDRVYGTEVRNDTTFVVTSGISGWAIPFKTGCISEYVIVDIYDR